MNEGQRASVAVSALKRTREIAFEDARLSSSFARRVHAMSRRELRALESRRSAAALAAVRVLSAAGVGAIRALCGLVELALLAGIGTVGVFTWEVKSHAMKIDLESALRAFGADEQDVIFAVTAMEREGIRGLVAMAERSL